MCGKCHTKINSRNKLFKHLEEANHIVISDGEDNPINRPANKRGSRKLSRSDRKFKQENFEEVGSIGDWLRSHGWKKDEAANHWTIEVADALSVPTEPFGFVESRVVTDSKSGHDQSKFTETSGALEARTWSWRCTRIWARSR